MKRPRKPDAKVHLKRFIKHLELKEHFTFIRFSDGENEILKNNYLEINGGITKFRGRTFKNTFPKFDAKKFDPRIHQDLRSDLLNSAMHSEVNYYKGILTSHNDSIKEREMMIRFNGGFDGFLTFTDLFLNSNYQSYTHNIVPLLSSFKSIYVIANFRAKPVGFLKNSKHIQVSDNFFANYSEIKQRILENLLCIEPNSIILSSASSLTNIIGYELRRVRKDVTFIDVGTTLNEYLSLESQTREYLEMNNCNLKTLKYRFSKRYNIKW